MNLDAMKILMIGARIVGHRCLDAILASGANVSALLYLDDVKSDVTVAHTRFDDLIARYRLNARSFASLKGEEGEQVLRFAEAAKPDLGIVVGVSQLVPAQLLSLPPLGFIGMHPTLLPQGRGRAPIPWALISDLKQTGVSLFYADADADTGDILDQESVPIFDDDTAPVLGARTDDTACRLLVKNLPKLASGTAARTKQDDSKATQWPRRRPEDGLIDWSKDARALYNWVRALTMPYPGAFTVMGGRKLFVWAAKEAQDSSQGAPGEIVASMDDGAVLAATGFGILKLDSVQWEDGPKVPPRAAALRVGMRLGTVT